jgi:hypothetical protein
VGSQEPGDSSRTSVTSQITVLSAKEGVGHIACRNLYEQENFGFAIVKTDTAVGRFMLGIFQEIFSSLCYAKSTAFILLRPNSIPVSVIN